MARLVNMHTAPLGTGHAHAAEVAPGATGEFNENNPAVKGWIRARWLQPEGAVLASKAAALADAPTRLEVATLRSQLASRDAVLEEMKSIASAQADALQRIEADLGEVAARAQRADALDRDLRAALEQIAQHEAAATAGRARIAELETQLASRDARITDLETQLTEPSGPAGGDADAAKPSRVRRQG
jgi:DNA repair exonuclease SbcCD ATPase subunit